MSMNASPSALFISQTHPEILCEIFKQACVPTEPLPGIQNPNSTYQSPLLFGAICKSWRELAWSCPGLWSHVNLVARLPSLPTQLELLDEWLERSKTCAKLSLLVNFTLYSLERFPKFLIEPEVDEPSLNELFRRICNPDVCKRIDTFDIHIPNRSCLHALNASRADLASLRRVKITLYIKEVSVEFLENVAGITQLDFFSFWGKNKLVGPTSCHNLTTISLACLYASAAVKILREATSLRFCRLAHIFEDEDMKFEIPTFELPHLQTLVLRSHEPHTSFNLLKTISMPQLRQLSLQYEKDATNDFFESHPEITLESLRIDFNYSFVHGEDKTPDDLDRILQHHPNTLRSLSIHVHFGTTLYKESTSAIESMHRMLCWPSKSEEDSYPLLLPNLTHYEYNEDIEQKFPAKKIAEMVKSRWKAICERDPNYESSNPRFTLILPPSTYHIMENLLSQEVKDGLCTHFDSACDYLCLETLCVGSKSDRIIGGSLSDWAAPVNTTPSQLRSIERVPRELWIEIFTLVCAGTLPPTPFDLEFTDQVYDRSTMTTPLQVGAVCSMWRQIVWSLPSLWTDIYLEPSCDREVRGDQADILVEWIERAGSLPLFLTLRVTQDCIQCIDESIEEYEDDSDVEDDDDPIFDIFDIILVHRARWVSLDLDVPYEGCVEVLRNSNSKNAKKNIWPLLKKATLRDVSTDMDIDVDFLTRPTALEELSIRRALNTSFKFPKACANLTRLFLESVQFYCMHPFLVSEAVNIQHLRLHTIEPLYYDGELGSSVALPNLETLALHCCSNEHMFNLFKPGSLPKLTKLSVTGDQTVSCPDMLKFFKKHKEIKKITVLKLAADSTGADAPRILKLLSCKAIQEHLEVLSVHYHDPYVFEQRGKHFVKAFHEGLEQTGVLPKLEYYDYHVPDEGKGDSLQPVVGMLKRRWESLARKNTDATGSGSESMSTKSPTAGQRTFEVNLPPFSEQATANALRKEISEGMIVGFKNTCPPSDDMSYTWCGLVEGLFSEGRSTVLTKEIMKRMVASRGL